jgi:minor extracellular serine protease Vpr
MPPQDRAAAASGLRDIDEEGLRVDGGRIRRKTPLTAIPNVDHHSPPSHTSINCFAPSAWSQSACGSVVKPWRTSMNRISVTALSAIVLLLSACGGGGNEAASSVESLSAPGRATVAGVRTLAPSGAKVDVRLRAAKGPVDVWVSMDQEPVAGQQAKLAESAGVERARALSARGDSTASARALADHRRSVVAQQRGIAASVFQMGGTELGRVQMAHNAIAMRVDASELSRIAALPGVVRVRPVLHYQLDLSETVPYVGGTAVQNSGRDGSGVTVAVLDSGIDYAHRNLGGEGTAEAYAAAYGAGPSDPKNTTLDGLFPTAKVVAGFDFVGETWGIVNNAEVGVLTEDPDPIDLEGHGTHVADIIAGQSLDGAHKGVAPGAKLVAVKVCSAISSACNGVALLKGMDYALDPNGDGDMSDAVDVINLSLGSPYGQVEDDLTLAAINAVKLGVIVVASAGNSANRPYVTGSPSIGPGVISVAQTAVPSASAIPLQINAPAAIAGIYGNTQVLEFAPVGAGVTGDVAFIGRGCPAGSVAGTPDEDPYLTSPAGKVVLIDRGSCGVSLKVDRAAKAGATGVLIGLVAAGDAVGFSSAGGDTFVPSLVITRAVSSAIKAQLTAGQTVNVSISPAAAIPLVGSMASSSSRGPSMSAQTIKPEIGAPGASLSAEAGTGNGQTAFGGTSGAAPMVAGAAALMVQAHPKRSALQIKAMLMNSAETAVFTNPALVPGELAPITRIGAGELRVDRAVKLTAAAWNRRDQSATLSFGAVEAAQPLTVERRQLLRQRSGVHRHTELPLRERRHVGRGAGARAVERARACARPRTRQGDAGDRPDEADHLDPQRRFARWQRRSAERAGVRRLSDVHRRHGKAVRAVACVAAQGGEHRGQPGGAAALGRGRAGHQHRHRGGRLRCVLAHWNQPAPAACVAAQAGRQLRHHRSAIGGRALPAGGVDRWRWRSARVRDHHVWPQGASSVPGWV